MYTEAEKQIMREAAMAQHAEGRAANERAQNSERYKLNLARATAAIAESDLKKAVLANKPE